MVAPSTASAWMTCVLSSLPGEETQPTKPRPPRLPTFGIAAHRARPHERARLHLWRPGAGSCTAANIARRRGAGGSRSSCGRATACHSSGCHSSVCHSSGCHPSACHYRGARHSCACGTDQRSVGCASSFHATRSALDIYCRALALEPSGLGGPVQLLRPALANRSQLPPRGLPFNWHGFR